MADLIAASDLKTHLQIAAATATWDTVLAALATAASKAIEIYCDREFTDTAARVEYYDGNGYDVLTPRHHPIISVTSLYDDPSRDFGASTLIDATYYYIDTTNGSRRIVLAPGPYTRVFAIARGNIKLTYRSGYASNVFPADLVLAAKSLGAFYFNRRKSEGRTNESMGNLSMSHAQEWPEDVRLILGRYRNQEYS